MECRSHLHGPSLKFDAESNGPTDVTDCQFHTALVDENLRHEIFGYTDRLLKEMLIHVGTDLQDLVVHVNKAAIILKKTGKMRLSVLHTPFLLYSTNKMEWQED